MLQLFYGDFIITLYCWQSFLLAKFFICLRNCIYWALELLMLFGWKYTACFQVAAYILYPLCSTLEHRNEKNHKEHNKNNNEWNCYQKNRRLTVAFIYLELSRKQKKVKTDKTEKWKLRQLQNICDNICGKEVIEFSSSGNRTITDDSLNT